MACEDNHVIFNGCRVPLCTNQCVEMHGPGTKGSCANAVTCHCEWNC